MISTRMIPWGLCIAAAVALAPFAASGPAVLTAFAIAASLSALGLWDLLQKKHSLMRLYPVAAHMRWLFEWVRPELRQYLFESSTDGTPFSRAQRSLVYERAKGVSDKQPFGTELIVYNDDYEWITHSVASREPAQAPARIEISGPQCTRPYSASLLNVSAMSFGSLGANAVRALNKAARMGNFAQDTGEGGISRYHREFGGDLVWEIASGYFGCRTKDGSFDPGRFAEQASNDQVKMVEIKISQGAKPGHGGILPGAKVTEEIAEARGVAVGEDCVSPPCHSAFSDPIGLMEFVARLRELSGGKPTGFKLCIGHPWEFLGICKAMMETGIRPDFIVVDGKEGGTGAAPLEFSNHVGAPLREGLIFVQNALVGANLRDGIRVGASGKVISAFNIAANLALGADWCNVARGFMFSVGCVQSQKCHTDRCPTGVTTQDPRRQRALVVEDKAERARSFHARTLHALNEVVAAAGLEHPGDLRPCHLYMRPVPTSARRADEVYNFLEAGELLAGTDDPRFSVYWDEARADSFAPVGGKIR